MDPEFSRIVTVFKIKQTPSLHEISADDEERKKLATRFGLIALDRLDAKVTLYRQDGDVRMEVELEADLVQPCVATLDPVPESVNDRFILIFRPGIDDEEADRLTLDVYDEEVVEPLSSETIDIGEAVAQQLSLVMEPFPRSESAIAASGIAESGMPEPFQDPVVDADLIELDTAMDKPRPFDILRQLKKG